MVNFVFIGVVWFRQKSLDKKEEKTTTRWATQFLKLCLLKKYNNEVYYDLRLILPVFLILMTTYPLFVNVFL